MRLSISSLAGIARTLVAVGTDRLAVMFCAVRAAVPRSRASWAPGGGATVPGAAAAGGAAGPAGRADVAGGGAVPSADGAGGAWRRGRLLGGPGVGGGGLVVGEEIPPGPIDGPRVALIPLVQLIDQPLIGPEVGACLIVTVLRRGLGVRGRPLVVALAGRSLRSVPVCLHREIRGRTRRLRRHGVIAFFRCLMSCQFRPLGYLAAGPPSALPGSGFSP